MVRTKQESGVREICARRSRWRGLETGLFEIPRQPPTLPKACSANARKVQNRQAKRRQRRSERDRRGVEARKAGWEVSAVRGTFDFAYRCDRCHATVMRRAGEQRVFCSESCRSAFRQGRRRLLHRHPSLARRWDRDEDDVVEDDLRDGHAVGRYGRRGYPSRP